MAKRARTAAWGRILHRNLKLLTGPALRAGRAATAKAIHTHAEARRPPPGQGDWLPGVVMGSAGARHYRVYRPPGLVPGERVPLLVMLHGCGQDSKSFALSTRMNRLAARERFLVLYPEQSRLANAHGCWNWFETDSGRAYGEVGLIMKAIEHAGLLYPVDRARVALVGLSAGASMAALLATRHPERFRAVVMHSGVAPGTAHSSMTAIGAMQGRRATALPDYPAADTRAAAAPAWPPLLVIHGDADHVVSVKNARSAAQAWAAASGAPAGKSRTVQRGKRHAMEVTDFLCGGHPVVQLVEVAGLGHAWSGGAASQSYSDSSGPDASRLAWAFITKALRN
ncbi:MAG TPA: PHB depolymerase family esterase [Rubrivivax sp.]|nr:PHB depolymerase family esterase [Rubrivivax sp.]